MSSAFHDVASRYAIASDDFLMYQTEAKQFAYQTEALAKTANRFEFVSESLDLSGWKSDRVWENTHTAEASFAKLYSIPEAQVRISVRS